MFLFNVQRNIVLFVALQFCIHGLSCSEFNNPDPDDDVEVFSSKEISSIINLNEEAFQPKIESIYVKTKIRFRFSRTRITSQIVNPDEKKAQNVTYILRIPNESIISRFEMRIHPDPKVYRAKVVKAEDARKMLQFAVGEGKSVTLGLLEQSELDFNEVLLKLVIGANKKIIFSLIYEERLPRIDNQYESVIYIVPEYMTNKIKFRVEVIIEENLRLTSIKVPLNEEYSSHNATVKMTSSKATVLWSNFNVEDGMWSYPKSEFIVTYSLENEISTGHILLLNGYFVHFFAPTDLEPLRKHVIFILDISDSMTGLKMNQTISAMIEILDELNPDDFFNIVTFSSEAHVWSCFHGKDSDKLFPFPADAKCKDEARHFISKIDPHGSTNMNEALREGLEIARNVSPVHSPTPPKAERYQRGRVSGYKSTLSSKIPAGVQSIIIFFTDGEPTSGIIDKRAILTKVKILNFNMSIPIFSLAFGKSADFSFLTNLSTRNGAFARKIYEDADPSFQLANFYREISSPVLANLSFKYDSGHFPSSPSIVTSGYSMAIQGQDIIVVGRLNQWQGVNKTGQVLINASVGAVGRTGMRNFRIPIKDCSVAGSCSDEMEFDEKCVEKLFVYLTLKKLTQEVLITESERTSDDDDDVKEGKLEAQRIKAKVTEIALQNGLITQYTSMVVRTKSVREEEMDVQHPEIFDSDNPKESEVEIFLGSETPLQDKSKTVEVDIDSIRSELQSLRHQDPLTRQRHLDRLDIPLKFIERYKLLELSNVSSDEAVEAKNHTNTTAADRTRFNLSS